MNWENFIRTHETAKCDPEDFEKLMKQYKGTKRYEKFTAIRDIVTDFEIFALENGIVVRDAEVFDADYDKVWH